MSGESLRSLAAAVAGRVIGDADVVVDDVTHDSRRVGQGSLFVAIPGDHVDGHDFIASAVERGAEAVVSEREIDTTVPVLVVDSTRARLARLAARVHGDPSHDMAIVGITGTNGKTTVAHLCEAIFKAGGLRPGRIGTTGAGSGGHQIETGHTTPEASDVQRLLATMRSEGVTAVAMEVSSHALAFGRVEEIEFRVAAFTNLSQDHLDFHGGMEEYFAAKRELFHRAPRAVVSIDDPWGRRLLNDIPPRVEKLTVGAHGDVRAADADSSMSGSRFMLHLRDDAIPVEVPLAGSFNIANSLVAAGSAHLLGCSLDSIAEGLAGCPPVPGRFEVVRSVKGTVVVDYAHTPDAIVAAIDTARSLTAGRVIAIFGAGGDRDRGKRPLMGSAASRADLAILTNDNPRSEDPEAIAGEVMAGMSGTCEIVVELDRRRALEIAVERAGPTDTVLLLGKGHEPGQAFADRVEPFDDRLEAARVLEVRA